jgi:hypothetical protein
MFGLDCLVERTMFLLITGSNFVDVGKSAWWLPCLVVSLLHVMQSQQGAPNSIGNCLHAMRMPYPLQTIQ